MSKQLKLNYQQKLSIYHLMISSIQNATFQNTKFFSQHQMVIYTCGWRGSGAKQQFSSGEKPKYQQDSLFLLFFLSFVWLGTNMQVRNHFSKTKEKSADFHDTIICTDLFLPLLYEPNTHSNWVQYHEIDLATNLPKKLETKAKNKIVCVCPNINY
jgi:hypothetical protein